MKNMNEIQFQYPQQHSIIKNFRISNHIQQSIHSFKTINNKVKAKRIYSEFNSSSESKKKRHLGTTGLEEIRVGRNVNPQANVIKYLKEPFEDNKVNPIFRNTLISQFIEKKQQKLFILPLSGVSNQKSPHTKARKTELMYQKRKIRSVQPKSCSPSKRNKIIYVQGSSLKIGSIYNKLTFLENKSNKDNAQKPFYLI